MRSGLRATGIAVVLIGISVAGFLALRGGGASHTAMLSDGTVLHLTHTSYGRKHVNGLIPTAKELQAMWAAKRWIPKRKYESDHELLGVWVRNDGPPSKLPVRIGDAALKNSAPQRVPTGITFFRVNGFRRGEPKITLDVEEFSPTERVTQVARWEIRNPGRSQESNWAAASLPQTQMIDDCKVTIEECERRWQRYGVIDLIMRYHTTGPGNRRTPGYERGQHGHELVRAVLMDRSGNAAATRIPQKFGSGEIKFTGAELDPLSQAWRARLAFVSTKISDSNSVWALNVPGVLEGEQTFEKDFSGTKIRLTGPTMTWHGTGYVITISQPDALFVMHARLADEKGSNAITQRYFAEVSSTEYIIRAGVGQLPSFRTNKTFRLDLSVKPARWLEFDFTPPKLIPVQ